MSGAGASALWKRKIKEKMQETVSQRADCVRMHACGFACMIACLTRYLSPIYFM